MAHTTMKKLARSKPQDVIEKITSGQILDTLRAWQSESETLDSKALLKALRAFRNGNFTVRLPDNQTGIGGEIARAFNESVELNHLLLKEFQRVGKVVGREGKIDQRVSISAATGSWAGYVDAFNSTVATLVEPISEFGRVVNSLISGDLSEPMVLEFEGKPLRGEFLRLAKMTNNMIALLNGFAAEITRVAREVGNEGVLGGQARVKGVSGIWQDLTDNVNTLADNLTTQVRDIARVTTAVANRDLGQKIAVEVKGEIFSLQVLNDDLAEQTLSMEALLDILPVSVVVYEKDGSTLFVNTHAQNFIGLTGKGSVDQQFYVRGTNEAYPRQRLQAKAGDTVYFDDVEVEFKDGSRMPVEVWSAPLVRNDTGEVLQSVLVAADISERLKLQKEHDAMVEAEAANQAKIAFLDHMSHELCTPLNAILGFGQLIAQSGDLNSVQQRNIDSVVQGGKHLLHLINNVLEISKVEPGRIDLNEVSFNIDDLCKMVREMFSPEAQAGGLQFVVERRIDLPAMLLGDVVRIRQVVVNLVVNAIKFTRHGEVSVTFFRQGDDRIAIEIRDTGLGIPAEQVDGLFEAFGQLMTNTEEGSGLGLAVTKHLVTMMGGTIAVESTVGKGSLFSVLLPLKEGLEPAEDISIESQGIVDLAIHKETLQVLPVDENATEKLTAALRNLDTKITTPMRQAILKGDQEAFVQLVDNADLDNRTIASLRSLASGYEYEALLELIPED